jgi:hypothetical protein
VSIENSLIDSKLICKGNTATAFCWINPTQEPSKHIIRDINLGLNNLKNNKINVVFITDGSEIQGLSKEIPTYTDKNFELLNKNSACSLSANSNVFPNIMLVSNNNCIFSSKGYIINVSEILINEWKKSVKS